MNEPKKSYLSWNDVKNEASYSVLEFVSSHRFAANSTPASTPIKIYGIPRGGIFAGQLLCQTAAEFGYHWVMVEDVANCNIIVDDLIDTGKTRDFYSNCLAPFFTLIHPSRKNEFDGWIVFPWERMQNEFGPEENVRRVLEFIGEDPNREGLRDTPSRVVRTYDELFGGYKQDPLELMTFFEDESYRDMVVLTDIEFYSTCEHHMLPFFGRAHIAYIPNGKVVGISKLARLLEVYSRRLQIQERLCEQVTGALEGVLQPMGSACVLEAQHFCMTSRGVQKQNSRMITSSLTGVFLDQSKGARSEFMSMIRK